jgi:hypothetical protein
MLASFALQRPTTSLEVVNISVPKEVMTSTAGVASFHFDWPESEVPYWSIEVYEDLSGRYDKLEAGTGASAATRRPIVVTKATMDRLRGGYKTVVTGNCETKIKHLAKTGAKQVAYTMAGSDVWASCTFNYSDDKDLMEAVAAFQAIAETMQFGDKLEHTHRYDRLGLDAQLDFLSAEAKDGRAIELQNIAPMLQSIVDDERVIDRARRKAARLLQDAMPASSQ